MRVSATRFPLHKRKARPESCKGVASRRGRVNGSNMNAIMRRAGTLPAFCLWLCALDPAISAEENVNNYVDAEVATVGFDMRSSSPVLVLQEQGKGRLLPIWVGFPEAQAIAIALHGESVPRPMSHDLMRSLVESSDLQIEMVRIERLVESTYHATIVGYRKNSDESKGEPIAIDCRPSDGMALALRLKVPIRVSSQLLLNIPEFDFSTGDDPGQLRALGMAFGIPNMGHHEALGRKASEPGLVVFKLSNNAPTGIAEGDLVSEANGRPLHSVADLVAAIRELDSKEAFIELKIHRGNVEWKQQVPILAPPTKKAPTRGQLEV